MSVETFLADSRKQPEFMRNVTAWQEMPAGDGRYAPLPPFLPDSLRQALHARGIDRLYSHQAEALLACRNREHIVVVTATASGKTLCYNLPVLETLLQNPAARALYLFPTKALAQDQLAELTALVAATRGPGGRAAVPALGVATYDGDTPKQQRRALRTQARILLTNPDMLHAGILPHHPQWLAFLTNLRYVIVDELHAYRGVFGSHVANVLRRLRRVCRFYGSEPQFICTSATIANPAELAAGLVGAAVRLIDDDGAPRGTRHMILVNPPLVDRDLGLRRSSVLEADQITGTLLAHQVQTIVFARSRLTTELLLTYLRRRVQKQAHTGFAYAGPGVDAEAVRGYRGGYLPQERRAIEAGLRQGSVRAVVATNALELGVDIGQLGAAVLTGFPGTIASTWQQAGRAGRRQGVSVALLIATSAALDQYVITHPRYFFERSPEHAYIHPDNLVILLNHLQCAAFELPFGLSETFDTVTFTQELLAYLAGQGWLHQSAEGWHWMSQSYPAERVSLRAVSGNPVEILATTDAQQAESTPDEPLAVIGNLDRSSAPIFLHEGAIYLHEGQSYEVIRLDWENSRAYVRPVTLEYYTEAQAATEVTVLAEVAADASAAVHRAYGDVRVTTQATGYRKVRLYTHENLGRGEIDLPEQAIETRACWLSFPDQTLETLRLQGLWRSDPIEDYGPNWQAQRSLVRSRDGYRCAVCGLPEVPGRQHDVHHIVPFRTFGYVPGPPPRGNQAYLEANRLENLVTLCRRCHRRAETAVHIRSGLAGLAYALANVTPLHLMCDPRDLGMTYDVKSAHNGLPTVTLYDRIAGGIGLAEHLYELHTTLLHAVRDLVAGCGCLHGCPACVGPTLEPPAADEVDTRQLTAALIDAALQGG